MISRVAAVSAVMVLLGACASPLVTPRGPSFQSKVTHVTDWSSLASRTVSRFAGTHPNSRVYVAPGPADMPFAATFRKQLEQELHDRNIDVVQTAERAAVLRFDVHAFWYRDERHKYPAEYATFWSTAYALGAQARGVSSIDTAAAIAAGAGPAADILKAVFDTTNAEVLVTLTVMDGTHLDYRDSETFYIRPGELSLYYSRVPDFVPQTKPAVGEEFVLPVRAGS